MFTSEYAQARSLFGMVFGGPLLSLSLLAANGMAQEADFSADATKAAHVHLASLLDADGYLTVPEGYSGSVDASGYALLSSQSGAPRFHSSGNRGSGFDANQRWAESLWLGGGCDDEVHEIAVGNDGEIYIGGRFTSCAGVAANRIIRFDPATNSWSALGSNGGNGLNGTVRVILAVGGELYVGGHFDQANVGDPLDAFGIAHWNGSSWSAVGSGAGQGVGNATGIPTHVTALAHDGSSLYAGGFFSHVNLGDGIPANNIARWDGSNWSSLGNTGGNGVDNAVFVLSLFNGDLYVGGSFVNANIGADISVRRLARWDGANWSAVGSGGGFGVDGTWVNALAEFNGELYVGGAFEQVNIGSPIAANRIARWNGTSWSTVGSGGGNGTSGAVRSMASAAGRLYVLGGFFNVNVGAAVSARNVAAWDGANWSALAGDAGEGVGAFAYAVAAVGEVVYAGGTFSAVNVGNPVPASRIARWHSGGWSALESGAQDSIRTMLIHDGHVYIAGDFTEIETASGPLEANRIARWDGSSWTMLGSNGGNGLNGTVLTLAASGSDIFAGGLFTAANSGNDVAANAVARWDGSQWHAIGNNGGNGIQGWVFALRTRNNLLYIGGFFFQVNVGSPISANHIVSWNGSDWQILGSAGGNGLNNAVGTLALDGNLLYAGGAFTEANAGNPIVANRIARWNGSSWQGLGSGSGNGLNDDVLAIAVSDGSVYVAGAFNQANVGAAVLANHIAHWNGSSWSGLGSDGGNGLDGVVHTLVIDGSEVYVGGDFENANAGSPVAAAHLARWDGSRWTALGSGTNDVVRSLVQADSETLYAAGDFTRAGGRVARRLGSYRTRGELAVQLSGNGSGDVESSPAAISCPGTCSVLLPWDKEYTLTATPDLDWLFLGWSRDGCSGTGPCSFMFEQDIEVQAYFGSDGAFHDRFEAP